MYVDRAVPDDLQALADTVERERPVAIGEIGLDRFVEPRDEQRQQELFVAQLKLARNHDLPVLLHVRRAIDQVLAQLRQVRVVGGIAHAFNGSRQQADEFIKLGFKLGFGGTLTYPGSQRIRALAASLPDEAIVLETDAPDIPPEWIARGRNTPGQLPLIAQMLAELRGTPVPDIIRQTHANALAVLPRLATIPPHGIH